MIKVSEQYYNSMVNCLKRSLEVAENQSCPVCGIYCLGNGGVGCIDKLYYFINARTALSNFITTHEVGEEDGK